MILTKSDLKEYLDKDRFVINPKHKRPRIIGDDIWKFEIYLRKHEYYTNIKQGIFVKILKKFYQFKHYQYGIKLGFTIPCNVFGPGLHISHYGSVIVSAKAKIGEFCVIHGGVNIGAAEGGTI